MSKIILHIDLNAFFVRCEEIKNPSLEGKPVIIGRNGRGGIVSTCSYEARKYGVHSAMPMNQAVKLCPHLIIIPGDYHFYSALSSEGFPDIIFCICLLLSISLTSMQAPREQGPCLFCSLLYPRAQNTA